MPHTCDPHRHHRPCDRAQGRRSIRLPGYDYSQPGAYFVTICAQAGECLFGEVAGGEMALSDLGRIAVEEWLQTPIVRPYVQLDEFIVMPNHVHAILCIVDDDVRGGTGRGSGRGTARRAPTGTERRFGHPIAGSLPTIVGAFKSAVTKRINRIRDTPAARVWQRGYYEHVIRDQEALNRIRSYIVTNPRRWDRDSQNPRRQGQDDFDRRLGSYGAPV